MSSISIEEMLKDDPGIDFTNYSLEEEIIKYQGVDPCAWQILIRIFVPIKVKKIGNIILSDESISKLNQDAKFTNLTGLVIKFGSGVYKDMDRYSLTGPYCKIGDWVQFPRADGYTFAHNKMSSLYIAEDRILGVIADPRTITRITT